MDIHWTRWGWYWWFSDITALLFKPSCSSGKNGVRIKLNSFMPELRSKVRSTTTRYAICEITSGKHYHQYSIFRSEASKDNERFAENTSN